MGCKSNSLQSSSADTLKASIISFIILGVDYAVEQLAHHLQQQLHF